MREAHAKGRLLDARMNGLTIFLIKNTERTVRRESKLDLAEKNISRDYFPVLLQHQRLVCLFKNIYIFVKFHLYTRLGIIEPCIKITPINTTMALQYYWREIYIRIILKEGKKIIIIIEKYLSIFVFDEKFVENSTIF